jgi:hypothetical protein
MGDLKVGTGGNDFPQIQLNPKAAEAPGPKITGPHVLHTKLPNQANDDSNITPEALAARKAEVGKRSKTRTAKPRLVTDSFLGGAARQGNAERLVQKVLTYNEDVQHRIDDAGEIFKGVKDHGPFCSGYLNRLGGGSMTDSNGVVPTNLRDKIQVVYDRAYKVGDPSQAQKSATEISSALRNALPSGVNSLGNIGESIPVGMQATNFDEAKGQLTAFANRIFGSPSTQGLYTQDEQAAVKKQVIERALEYAKAANVDVNDAMQLVRDNLIKIHHQQTVDHEVVSGSDHGVRHVIQSNVANTLNALDQVANVSPREKLMAMQIMIDHDLGYTTDAARGDLGASKDHPLASTAYMELGGQNSSVFTPEEQAFMRDAVLKHSYPFGLDQPFNFPAGDDADAQRARQTAIAGIVSVVDAMGTTQDTKCPAIFREDPCLAILKKLAHRDINDNEAKQQMHAAIDADTSISQDVKAGYHLAVDYDVNKTGAGMIMPQFGGTLNSTSMNQGVLSINMQISQDIADLATVVGDQNAIKAFNKLGEDMISGLSEDGQIALKQTLVERGIAKTVPQADGTMIIDPEFKLKTALGEVARAVQQSGRSMTVPLGAISITLNP